MGEVPRSLTELKVQLGRDILIHEMKSVYGRLDDTMQGVIDRAPVWHHVEAADRWRAAYEATVDRFGQVAARALPSLPDNQDQAMDSLLSDLHGVLMHGDIVELRNSNADAYFGKLLRDVFNDGPANAKLCLEALVAFARGE